MKFLPHAALFLVAGSLAFGAVVFAKSRWAPADARASAAAVRTLSPEEEAAVLKKELAAARSESGPAMRERLAATFKLLGIEATWAEALSADSAAGFPALMEKLASSNPRHRALLELMLLDRWAQLDPEGGAAYFKAKADADPQNRVADDALANFIRQWGLVDFEKAAAKAGEFGAKTTRRTLREKAKTDPEGFLAWAKNHPEINPFTIFVSGSPDNALAVAHLAELDLDRVLAWAKDAPTGRWRSELGPALAEKLAQRNPEEAIAWAKSLGDKAATSAALAGVAKALADTDPTRALGLLKEMGGGSDYALVGTYREIIEKLGLNDTDRALSVVEDLPRGGLREQILSQVLSKLMASNPEKAFALAEKLGPGGGNMMFGMNDSMAPKTPADARRLLDIAEKAGDSNFRNQVLGMSMMGWFQADQRSLAEYLKAKIDSPMFNGIRNEFGPGLAMMMLQSGQAVDPRLAEAVGIKPETTVQAMADRDPEAAASELTKVADGTTRIGLVENIAQNWANRDRGDAIDWAGGLTNPDEQAAAYRSLAAGWMQEDSHRASQWISTLPAGKPRDAAVLAMAQQVAHTDPDLSWQWGLTMADPGLRTEALGHAAREWSRVDGAAFEAALANSALADTDRAAITKAMQTPSPPGPQGGRGVPFIKEEIMFSPGGVMISPGEVILDVPAPIRIR
jgi:hypothetical protein